MGIFDRFRRKAAPDIQPIDFLSMLTNRGKPARKGTLEMLVAYRTSPWLHSVVRRVSVEFAMSLHWRLYDRPPEAEDPRIERIYDDPILRLLAQPNDLIPTGTFWQIVDTHLELAGEAFLLIDPNRAGWPARLTPIVPTMVKSTPSKADPYFTIQPMSGGAPIKFAADEVIHLPDPDPLDPFSRGTGTALSLADEISTDENAAKNLNAFFFNGMMPDVLVSLQGANVDELKKIYEDFQQKYGGPKKAHRTHFTGKSMQVQRLDTSFKEMALVDIRNFIRNTIHQVFNVPPEVVGIIENSNRATSEAAYYIFGKGCLYPRMAALASALQLKLVPRFGVRDRFLGFKNPIPEDRDFQLRAMATSPTSFTQGEIRVLAGFVPGERADEPLSQAPIVAGPTNVPPGKFFSPATELSASAN